MKTKQISKKSKSAIESENIIPALNAALFSVKYEYLELKETSFLLKQFWLRALK